MKIPDRKANLNNNTNELRVTYIPKKMQKFQLKKKILNLENSYSFLIHRFY